MCWQPSSLLALILAVATSVGASAAARAGGYTVEPFEAKPPTKLAPELLSQLSREGFRVVDEAGKAFAEIWLREAIPAAGLPEDSNGAIQYPYLSEGEFLGLLRFAEEGRDFRDQSIAKGVYTLRYGLQPVNQAHVGKTPFRDFLLLVPRTIDRDLANIPPTLLHEKSAESAGTTHPACLMLNAPKVLPARLPAILHDEAKATWTAILPARFVETESKKEFAGTFPVVIVGVSMVE